AAAGDELGVHDDVGVRQRAQAEEDRAREGRVRLGVADQARRALVGRVDGRVALRDDGGLQVQRRHPVHDRGAFLAGRGGRRVRRDGLAIGRASDRRNKQEHRREGATPTNDRVFHWKADLFHTSGLCNEKLPEKGYFFWMLKATRWTPPILIASTRLVT